MVKLFHQGSLQIIYGQTALHTTFCVAFCFIRKEKFPDYTYVMQQLKTLYSTLKHPPPTVAVIDMEFSLINAIREVFLLAHTRNLLCLWHINKNVVANCRASFSSKKEFDEFHACWNKVVYASSPAEYHDMWDELNDKYALSVRVGTS